MKKKEVKIEGLVKTNYKEISLNIFEKFRDVKLIVFDFDNTLYQNIDWQGYNEFVLKNIRKIFKRLTDKQFEDLLKKYNYTGDRVIEKFAYMVLKEKGSTKKFYKFVKKIKFEGNYKNVKLFPPDIIKELEKKYILYILSNSSPANIKFVSGRINLKLKPFKKIFSNKFEKDDLSKSKRFKDILKQSKLRPNQILMLGDSVEYDLLPAKELGMQVLFIEN